MRRPGMHPEARRDVPPARWRLATDTPDAPPTQAQRVAVGLLAHLLVTAVCAAAVVFVVILAPAPL